jgi:predicted O-methyltransferase YrrM
MGTVQKLRTFAWFVRRPDLYPELIRQLKTEVRRTSAPDGLAEAGQWCADAAIDRARALEQLTGSRVEYGIQELFADVVAAAQARVAEAMSNEPADMPWAGAADVDVLYWIAERSGATRVVETGVAYGWSSLALLLSLASRPSARLVSTDMPLPRTTGAYVGSAVPNELRAPWTLLRGLDRKVLPRALDDLGTVQLCHYDSDKTYEGRWWASHLIWEALESGGHFISDDVGDNFAFRDFASKVGVDPVVIPSGAKHVGILAKP